MDDENNDLKELGKKAGSDMARKVGKKITKAIANIIKKVISLFIKLIGKYLLIIIVGALIVASIWYLVTKINTKIIRDSVNKSITSVINPNATDDESSRETENLDFSAVTSIEGNDNDGYYIKVSSEIIEKIIANLEEEDIQPKDLGLESFDCFKAFIEAELITQYPNLGNVNIPNNSKDIMVNGCINIVRAQVQNDGNTKETTLKYTTLDNFNNMCESNNLDVLNYFTLDQEGKMLLASSSYTKIVVETSGDTSILEDIPTNTEEEPVRILSPIDYKRSINKYTMPFMFPIDILQSSGGEDLAVAIAELAKDTSMTITIEDNTQTTNSITTEIYEQSYRSKDDENSRGNKKLTYEIQRKYQEPNGHTYTMISANYPKTINIGNTDSVDKTCTVTIKTTTKTNTPNIELTSVDSWIAKASKTYTASIESNSSGPSKSETSEKTDANADNFNINTDNDVNLYMNGIIEKERQAIEEKEDSKNVTIQAIRKNLDVSDLALYNKVTTTYQSNTESRKYTSTTQETTINEQKIFDLFDENEDQFAKMNDAREFLYEELEENTNTVNFADIMRYLINKYLNPNYEGTLDLNAFDLEGFTSALSMQTSVSMIKEYIHSWEGRPKQEGDNYIIFDDGYGNATVGWGICIDTSGYKQEFINAGHPTQIGGKVPKEFVDSIEDEVIQSNITSINNLDLNLTSYQVAALVSRKYNVGNLSGFKTAYNKYWKEEYNKKYYEYNGADIYAQDLYTNYMNEPYSANGKFSQGLVNRRKSEWLLFMTGYCDRLDKMWPIAADTPEMTNGISYYDASGNVSQEAVRQIEEYLTKEVLHTTIHSNHGHEGRCTSSSACDKSQAGPFAKWWENTGLQAFQCTWWANGRADQYLEIYGTKYTRYPTEGGHGKDYYSYNVKNGWFAYGNEPRPNSIISWSGGNYGHVAYVEAVDSTGIWISHAGSGKNWRSITKLPLNGYYGSSFTLNGYIYLDQPL